MTTTTWKDVREAANRRLRLRLRWSRLIGKIGVPLGCILIGLALGYLSGRGF